MDPSPELFHRAASFDWEALIPILFFVLYGLAQFLGSRKSAKDVPEDEAQEEVDPLERARQIREEIRRKMEARTKDSPQKNAEASPARSFDRPQYDPRLPENQQQRRAASPQPEPRQSQTSRRTVVHEARPVMASSGGTDIEKRLREQRQRLAEARKRQQEAREEARQIVNRARGARRKPLLEAKGAKTAQLDSLKSFRRQVILGLRDPNSLRKAVLYREILDPPVGMR